MKGARAHCTRIMFIRFLGNLWAVPAWRCEAGKARKKSLSESTATSHRWHSGEHRWSCSLDGSDVGGQPSRVVSSALVIEQGGWCRSGGQRNQLAPVLSSARGQELMVGHLIPSGGLAQPQIKTCQLQLQPPTSGVASSTSICWTGKQPLRLSTSRNSASTTSLVTRVCQVSTKRSRSAQSPRAKGTHPSSRRYSPTAATTTALTEPGDTYPSSDPQGGGEPIPPIAMT